MILVFKVTDGTCITKQERRREDVENPFLVRVCLLSEGKPSPGTCHWPKLCHMATPSCKGGWKFEYFAFKPLYYKKAGKKEIKMNECCELIVFVQHTFHRKQMIVLSLCSDSQETSEILTGL